MSNAHSSPISAVFLDRDGVLNVYLPGDYVKSPAELRLLPGVAQAVRKLNEAKIPVFLISNQQGVAKGLMTGEDLQTVDRVLRDRLASEAGATIAQSYYCPHAKADDCDCRKPKGGMLLDAAREHGIDLAASTFVGDTETDAQAARAAGVGRFILVLTGKYRDCPEAAQDPTLFPVSPNQMVPDLKAAVDAILSTLTPEMIPARFRLADSQEDDATTDALPRVATIYDAYRAIADGAMGLEFVGQHGKDGQPTPFFYESRIITLFCRTFREILLNGQRERNLKSVRGGLVAHETRTRQSGSIVWIENPTDEPITGSIFPYLPEVTVAPKSIFPYVHDAPIGSGATYLGAYAGLVKSDAPVLTAHILPDPHDGIRVYVYGEQSKTGETREVAIWSGNDRGRGVEVQFTATPQFYTAGTSQVVALPATLAGRTWLPPNLDGGAPVLIGPDDVLTHGEWEATVLLAPARTHLLYSLRTDGAITEIVVESPAPACATNADFDDSDWHAIDLAADGNGGKSGWYRALLHLPDGDGGDAEIHYGDGGKATKRLGLWVNGTRANVANGSIRLQDGKNWLCLFADSEEGFGPVSVTPSGGCYLIDVAQWRFAPSVAPVVVTIAL